VLLYLEKESPSSRKKQATADLIALALCKLSLARTVSSFILMLGPPPPSTQTNPNFNPGPGTRMKRNTILVIRTDESHNRLMINIGLIKYSEEKKNARIPSYKVENVGRKKREVKANIDILRCLTPT